VSSPPRLGVVIVTMGTRPAELDALLGSVARQNAQAARVVVVGNGTPLVGLPGWVTRVPLEENLGCPGGRNVGLRLLLEPGDVDVVIELDDDGLLIADDVFARVQRLYAADPALGIVSFRVADEQGRTLRRHVPRLRTGDPLRRGPVTLFPGRRARSVGTDAVADR
jgi:GT2 family glycosyltransferase